MNVANLLEMSAASSPEAVAVSAGEDSMTRAQLLDAARGFSRRLTETEVEALLYLGANDLAFPVACFAAAFAGVPFMPLNYRMSAEQLGVALDDLGPFALVADERNAALAEALAPAVSLTTDEVLGGHAPAGEDARPAPTEPDAIAVLLLTSGTTAAPKKVVLRHRHVFSYVISNVEFQGAAPGDAALVVVPPYHIAGVANLLSNVYSGRRVVYLQQFSPADWLEVAAREEVTHAMVVPTMLVRILDELDRGQSPPRSLRSMSYGGAKVARSSVERALAAFPDVDLVNAYGLTETSSTIAVLSPEDHRRARGGDPAALTRLDSVGRVVPGIELEIRDEGPAAVAGAGGVWVRGAQVSGEYLDGSRLDGDGWFPTRDIGWVDDEGYLFVLGRGDDTIIRGGENIAPGEIEERLVQHPAVAEAAAFGVPDEEWGERIAAAVVLAEGEHADAAELDAWARQILRSSKAPDLIVFRDELPHSETGKLLRRVLVDEFAAEEQLPR